MIIGYCLALQAKSAAAYNGIPYGEKTGIGCCITKSKKTSRL